MSNIAEETVVGSPAYWQMNEAGYMDLLRQIVPLEFPVNTEAANLEDVRLIESTIRYIEELTGILEETN